jgi:ERCC4-type nuclease
MSADTESRIIFEVDTNSNEDGIYEGLKTLPGNLSVQRRRLDVGDILVTYEKGVLIFERKTWDDLRGSIIDSRNSDQKMRLKKYMCDISESSPEKMVRTIFVIEGKLPLWEDLSKHSKLPNSRLYQNLFLMQMRDGFGVICLNSVEDICKSIAYIGLKACNGGFEQSVSREVGGRIAKSSNKRKNLESESGWFNMLCSIHGMGEKRARVISTAYPDAKKLLNQYIHFSESEKARIEVLSQLKSGNKSLGNSISKKVHDAIYGNKPVAAEKTL